MGIISGHPGLQEAGYQYMEDLLKLDACRPLTQSSLPEEMKEIIAPLRWREWDHSLWNHQDQRFRKYIVDGIRHGFRVGFNYELASSVRSSSHNMVSASEHPEVIQGYLAEECSEGRVLGLLSPTQVPSAHISSFGVIPKGTSVKWRLIVDMSAPEGRSVNDGVSEHWTFLKYVGVKDAAHIITFYVRGALLAKVDVKSAYRNIPVLMGMLWGENLFIDTALLFGLRSAPKTFSAVADAVEWVARQEGVKNIIHYLDDFLIVAAPDTDEGSATLKTVLGIFDRLGLPVAANNLPRVLGVRTRLRGPRNPSTPTEAD